MNECVEGTVEITAEDLHHGLRELPGAVTVRLLPLIMVVPVVVWSSGGVSLPSLLSVLFLVALFAYLALGKRAARSQFKTMKPESRHVRFRFDAEGVEFETPLAHSKFSYHALQRFREGKHTLLLFTQGNFAQIVPKRALTDEQLGRVRGWLQVGVKPVKQPSAVTRLLVLWLVLIVAFLAIWLLLAPGPQAP